MRRSLVLAATALAIVAPLVAASRPAGPGMWRVAITPADRDRLRQWRDAWMLGLRQARDSGAGAGIAAEGALLDPDAALENAAIPDGDYRCRTIKLGRRDQAGLAFVVYPAFTCRVGDGRFVKLDGSQRPAGWLWPMDPTRLVFLGAMALGDEPRALDYGRDADRDMVGVVERFAPERWRLVLPRPRWESQIDVIELVPKAVAITPPGGGG